MKCRPPLGGDMTLRIPKRIVNRLNWKKPFTAALAALASVVLLITPLSTSALTYTPDTFEVHSESAILVNTDTGTVVYEKNADQQMLPASLVKIMTFIIAVETWSDLDGTTITMSRAVQDELYGRDASNAGILVGETVTLRNLLYALMLNSACEAASMIAEYYGNGDQQPFIDAMNAKAQEIGCTNTHFTNAHGLDDPNQYSTARDMYLITQYAYNMPIYDDRPLDADSKAHSQQIFDVISSTDNYYISPTNLRDKQVVVHTNAMVREGNEYYYEYSRGVKTGTTDQNTKNLVTAGSKDGFNYICVVMGAQNLDDAGNATNYTYIDTINLYDWAFDTFATRTVVTTGDYIEEANVQLASGKNYVLLSPAQDVICLIPNEDLLDLSTIQKVATVNEEILAPVHKGDVLGSLELRLQDETLATVDLVATEDVEVSWVSWTLYQIWQFLTNPWVILAIVLIVVLVVVLILVRPKRKKKGRGGKTKYRHLR